MLFDFDGDDVDLGVADVLQGVRREGRYPESGACRKRLGASAVERDGPAFIAADEVAGAKDIESGGPAVSVERSRLAGSNEGVEDSDAVVLEEEFVVLGCGGQGI